MPFIYATSAEMMEIEPDLIQRDRINRLGIELMPVRAVRAAKVRWTQRDNYFGLQQLRGMNGQPTYVSRVGRKVYEYEPGVFGEFVSVDETELTTRAAGFDPATTPIPVGDLVAECDDLLVNREDDRIESSNWALLTTGTITIKIAGPNGTQVGYSDTYPVQTFTAGVSWATLATSTPVRDFQAVVQLAVGHSVSLGTGAIAVMNSVTANNLINNANGADLNGRRAAAGATLNNLNDINGYLGGLGLPNVRVYDGGYIATSGGAFTRFIPNNKVVVVGQRVNGAKVGEYLMTINASNNFQPGSYRYVTDRANGNLGTAPAEKRTPANIEVHRGHNGGPVIYYPSAIVIMNV